LAGIGKISETPFGKAIGSGLGNLFGSASDQIGAANTYNAMMQNGGFGTGNFGEGLTSAVSGAPIDTNLDLGQFLGG
jgi:hypothetical protein